MVKGYKSLYYNGGSSSKVSKMCKTTKYNNLGIVGGEINLIFDKILTPFLNNDMKYITVSSEFMVNTLLNLEKLKKRVSSPIIKKMLELLSVFITVLLNINHYESKIMSYEVLSNSLQRKQSKLKDEILDLQNKLDLCNNVDNVDTNCNTVEGKLNLVLNLIPPMEYFMVFIDIIQAWYIHLYGTDVRTPSKYISTIHLVRSYGKSAQDKLIDQLIIKYDHDFRKNTRN
tara:strand:- start:1503 stop:2189 length:687 start_codon:yes stop_codon:yes gene_type:complete